MTAPESGLQRFFRITVAIFLIIETAILVPIATLFLILTPFLGSLAFLGGAGDASDSKIAAVFVMVFLMMIGPFATAIALTYATVNLFQRTRPIKVALCCLWGVIVHIVSHFIMYLPFNVLSAVTLAVPLAGIVVALTMKVKRTAGEAVSTV